MQLLAVHHRRLQSSVHSKASRHHEPVFAYGHGCIALGAFALHQSFCRSFSLLARWAGTSPEICVQTMSIKHLLFIALFLVCRSTGQCANTTYSTSLLLIWATGIGQWSPYEESLPRDGWRVDHIGCKGTLKVFGAMLHAREPHHAHALSR